MIAARRRGSTQVEGRTTRGGSQPAHRWRCAVLLAVLAAPSWARAGESYDQPIAGVAFAEGPRWGWGSAPAATLGGAGLFAGWRTEAWRLGVLGGVDWWEGSRGPVVDLGGFVSYDYASLWVDPQLSLATFVRAEPTFRWDADAGVGAFAPSLVLGARAAGLEIGFAGTYEQWASAVPHGASKSGAEAELRVGLDLVELCALVKALNAGGTKPPP